MSAVSAFATDDFHTEEYAGISVNPHSIMARKGRLVKNFCHEAVKC
jgi:hypothetical protein